MTTYQVIVMDPGGWTRPIDVEATDEADARAKARCRMEPYECVDRVRLRPLAPLPAPRRIGFFGRFFCRTPGWLQ